MVANLLIRHMLRVVDYILIALCVVISFVSLTFVYFTLLPLMLLLSWQAVISRYCPACVTKPRRGTDDAHVLVLDY